jgi:hypothetical protein
MVACAESRAIISSFRHARSGEAAPDGNDQERAQPIRDHADIATDHRVIVAAVDRPANDPMEW